MRKFFARDWKVNASLHVGAKGTLREYEQFGDALICIRYRYNKDRTYRLKTVEIVVKEAVLRPEPKETLNETEKAILEEVNRRVADSKRQRQRQRLPAASR